MAITHLISRSRKGHSLLLHISHLIKFLLSEVRVNLEERSASDIRVRFIRERSKYKVGISRFGKKSRSCRLVSFGLSLEIIGEGLFAEVE